MGYGEGGMTTELIDRIAKRFAEKQGHSTQWPIYVGHAQEALAEVAAFHGIPASETDLPTPKRGRKRAKPAERPDMAAIQARVRKLTTPPNETTSPEVASIAARGLSNPESLTPDEIKSVCASALTQVA